MENQSPPIIPFKTLLLSFYQFDYPKAENPPHIYYIHSSIINSPSQCYAVRKSCKKWTSYKTKKSSRNAEIYIQMS